MHKIAVLLIVLFTSLSTSAQSSIEGIWDTGKDQTKIEIKGTDDEILGIIYSSDNAKADLGKLIIKDLKEIKGVYKGKLYVAKKDRWVDATFSSTRETLFITVSAGFRKKTIAWERAD